MSVSLNVRAESAGFEYIASDSTHPKTELHFHLPNRDENSTKIVRQIAANLFDNLEGLSLPLHITLTNQELLEANQNINTWVSERCRRIVLDVMFSVKSAGTAREVETKRKKISASSLNDLKKRVAHTNGDLFVATTGLEGNPSLLMMQFLRDFLIEKIAKLKASNDPNAKNLELLLNNLKRGIALKESFPKMNPSPKEITEAVSIARKTISSLNPGEKIIVGGGWISKDAGHAIYYQITRKENGNFTFEMFNKGDGIQYQKGVTILTPDAPGREPKLIKKYLTHRVFDEVNAERMSSEAFWKTFLELSIYRNIPKEGAKATEEDPLTDYGSADHEILIGFLQGKEVEHPNPKPEDFSIPQHSGVCSWAGLEEVVKKYVPLKDADRLLLEIELQSLEDLYDAFENPATLASDEQARLLLHNCAVKCASISKSLFEKKVILLEELEKANQLIAKANKVVEEAKKIADKQIEREALTDKVAIESVKQDSYGEITSPTPAKLDSTAASKPSPTALHWDPAWTPVTKSLVQDLDQFSSMCTKMKDKRPHAVAWFLRELFIKLPMPAKGNDSFWGTLSETESEACMKALSSMSELLTAVCFKYQVDANPQKRGDFIISLYKGLCIQHRLACNLKQMQELGVKDWFVADAQFFTQTFRDESHFNFKIYDGEMVSQYLQVKDYIKIDQANSPDFFTVNSYNRKESSYLGSESKVLKEYIKTHSQQFDKCYGSQLSPVLKRIDGSYDIDKIKILFAMGDLAGEFLPNSYCYLKRQALLSHFFLLGKKFEMQLYISPEKQITFLPTDDREGISLLHNEKAAKTDFTGKKQLVSLEKHALQYQGPLSTMEAVELGSIVSTDRDYNTEELKVVQALEGFSPDSDNDTLALHFEKLSDHDFRCFLKQVLFNKTSLLSCIVQSPEIGKRFLNFVQKGFQHFLQSNKIIEAAFMIYLGQMFKDMALQHPDQKELKPFFEQIQKEFNTEILLKDLLKKAKSVEEKAEIYRLLVFEYYLNWNDISRIPEKEKPEKFIEIASALAFLEASASSLQNPNSHLTYVEEKFKLRFQPQLAETLFRYQIIPSTLALRIATALGTNPEPIKSMYNWNLDHPLVIGKNERNEECIINIETFVYSFSGKNVVFLPRTITNDIIFKFHFPHLHTCEAKTDGRGLYEFTDKDCQVRIKIESQDKLIIQRQFQKNGPWYEYRPTSEFDKILDNKHFKETKTFWVALDRSNVLLCDRASKEITHKLVLTKNRFNLVDKSDRILVHPDNLPSGLKKAIQQFELSAYTNIWMNPKSGEIEEIEMPRLKLNFDVTSTKNGLKAVCRQVTGFYLSEKQYVKQLGSFKNFLVLENEKGKKKVIIPRKKIEIVETGSLTSKVYLADDFPVPNSKYPAYLEYNLNPVSYTLTPEQELESIHEAENLQLAHIMIGQRRYREAQQLLREKSRKNKRYTNREMEMIQWMTNLALKTGDNHPKACALYLTTCSMLLKNLELFGKSPLSTKMFEKLDTNLKKEYDNYLSLQEYMGDLLLTPQEELTLVKRLSKAFPNDEFIKNRLAVLMFPPPAGLSSPFPQKPVDIARTSAERGRQLLETIGSFISRSRPDPNLQYISDKKAKQRSNLDELYKQAKNVKAGEAKQLAMTFEMMGRFTELAKECNFLATVCLNPKNYPDSYDPELLPKDPASSVVVSSGGRGPPPLYPGDDEDDGPDYDYDSDNEKDKKAKMAAAAPKVHASFHDEMTLKGEVDKKISSLEVDEKAISERPIFKAIYVIPPSDDLLQQIFVKSTADQSRQKVAAQLKAEMEQKGNISISGTGEKIRKEFCDDIEAYGNETPSSTYHIKLDDKPEVVCQRLDDTVALLEKRRIESSLETENLRTKLLEFANRSFPNGIQTRETAALQTAEVASSEKPILTPELLAIIFLKSPASIKQYNRLLTDEDIAILKKNLTEYFVRVTDEQKICRQAVALKNMADHIRELPANHDFRNDITLQDLTQKASVEFTSKRAYIPENDFAFLVFETFSEMMMRPDQVQNIRKLHNADYKILQMIMGSGKTKVLLLILALLQADGDNLSVLIVPPSLYDSAMKDLRHGVLKNFGRFVHGREFNRDTEFSVDKLRGLFMDLEAMRKNGEPLIMTSKSMACLLLKFKEFLKEYATKPYDTELRQKLHLLQNILKLFKTKGKAIIDESDLVLNSKLEVNFTVGDPKSMDAIRCSLITTLYEQLTHNDIQKACGGDPIKSCTLQPEEFAKQVKPLLIDKMLSKSPLNEYMKSSNLDTKKIKDYLSGLKTDEITKYIESIKDTQCRDLIILLKEELNSLLPLTLGKRFCVDYGPSLRKPNDSVPSRSIAIPYSGNNTPVESSEFRSSDAIVNYTIQSCWNNGLTLADVQKVLKYLSGEASKESDYKKTAAFQLYKEICGDNEELLKINLVDMTTSDHELVRTHLNAYRTNNPQKFFSFVNTYVLSQINVYEEQLTSTAMELTGLFKSAIGFTGTPWNHVTQREKLNINTEKAKGTDGKTAVILCEKTKNKIRCLKDSTYPAVIEDLVQLDEDALIDTGAVFNGKGNKEVAEKILESLLRRGSTKTGVVFFQKNAQMILEAIKTKDKEGIEKVTTRIIPLSDSSLQPEQRYVYYDQSHTTGQDISLAPFAKAKQTIGKDDKTRDWFQGAWRLRGIDKQQSISIDILPEARQRMDAMFGLRSDEPVVFKHLLQFANSNQEKQLLSHLMIAVKQKIEFVLHQAVLEHLLELNFKDGNLCDENNKLINQLQSLLVLKKSNSPYELYEKEQIPQGDIKEQIKQVEKALEAIDPGCKLFKGNKEQYIENLKKEMNAELGAIASLLPDKATASQIVGGKNEGEVEQQKIAEHEIDVDTILSSITSKPDTPGYSGGYKEYPNLFAKSFYSAVRDKKDETAKIHRLEELFSKKSFEMTEFAPLVKGILASQNLTQPVKPIFKPRKNTLQQYFAFIRDKQTGKLEIQPLSLLKDFPYFWKALSVEKTDPRQFKTKEVEVCLCNSLGDLLQTGSEMSEAFKKDLAAQANLLRVRVKLLMGQINFTKSDGLIVQSLIKEYGPLIGKYFQQHILPNDKMKLLLFKKSQMFKWLGEPVWVNKMLVETFPPQK